MGRSILQCKWALQIIISLAESPKRPSMLLKDIKGISEPILYKRLNSLRELNIIKRKSNNRYPLKVLYSLNGNKNIINLVNFLKNLTVPVQDFVSLMSCKWTLSIIKLLSEQHKPSELKKKLQGISEKTLFKRLSELERIGIVQRIVVPSRPVKVYYRLTNEGISLVPSLEYGSRLIFSIQKRQSQTLKPVHDSRDSLQPCP
ncbi:MAG: transcriptional regulator [Nitrospirae bacterium]|nr:MAG: transcriptional regulator [Nitrospirota bacterium]